MWCSPETPAAVKLDGERLTYEFVIENGNEGLLEVEEMDAVSLDTRILKDDDENYNVSCDIRFRLADSGDSSERVYVIVNIPLEYDEALNHYCPKGSAAFDYLVGNPADWG